MLKKKLLTIVLCAATLCVIGKNKSATCWDCNANYEIETLTTATRGSKLIKVWAFDPKFEGAINQAKKGAILAAIFRGYPAGGSANKTPPLLTNTDEINTAYFDAFFATGGDYMKFVSKTSDQVPSGRDRLKVSKGYKVGVVLQVQYENLRNQLIKDGIIRGLNTGF